VGLIEKKRYYYIKGKKKVRGMGVHYKKRRGGFLYCLQRCQHHVVAKQQKKKI